MNFYQQNKNYFYFRERERERKRKEGRNGGRERKKGKERKRKEGRKERELWQKANMYLLYSSFNSSVCLKGLKNKLKNEN